MQRSFLCLSRRNVSDAALGPWWDLQFPVPDALEHLGRPFIQWSDAVPSFSMDFGWLWIRRTGPFAPCYIQGFLSSHGCPEPRKASAVQEKVFCISRERERACVCTWACVRARVGGWHALMFMCMCETNCSWCYLLLLYLHWILSSQSLFLKPHVSITSYVTVLCMWHSQIVLSD